MSAERVTNLYNLMDAEYDSYAVYKFSRLLGHVPIVDRNKHRREKKELAPAKKSQVYRAFRSRTCKFRFKRQL